MCGVKKEHIWSGGGDVCVCWWYQRYMTTLRQHQSFFQWKRLSSLSNEQSCENPEIHIFMENLPSKCYCQTFNEGHDTNVHVKNSDNAYTQSFSFLPLAKSLRRCMTAAMSQSTDAYAWGIVVFDCVSLWAITRRTFEAGISVKVPWGGQAEGRGGK